MAKPKSADLALVAIAIVAAGAVVGGVYWWRTYSQVGRSVGSLQTAASPAVVPEPAPAAAPPPAAAPDPNAAPASPPPAPTPEAAPPPVPAPAAAASAPLSTPTPAPTPAAAAPPRAPAAPSRRPARGRQSAPTPAPAPSPAPPPAPAPAAPEPAPAPAPPPAAPPPAPIAAPTLAVKHLHSRSIKRFFASKGSCEGELQLVADGVMFKTTRPGDRPPEQQMLTFAAIKKATIDGDKIRLEADDTWEFVAPPDVLRRIEEHVRAGKQKS